MVGTSFSLNTTGEVSAATIPANTPSGTALFLCFQDGGLADAVFEPQPNARIATITGACATREPKCDQLCTNSADGIGTTCSCLPDYNFGTGEETTKCFAPCKLESRYPGLAPAAANGCAFNGSLATGSTCGVTCATGYEPAGTESEGTVTCVNGQLTVPSSLCSVVSPPETLTKPVVASGDGSGGSLDENQPNVINSPSSRVTLAPISGPSCPCYYRVEVDDGQRRRAVRVIYAGPAPTSGFLDVPLTFGYGSNLLRIVMGDNTGAENGVTYTVNVNRPCTLPSYASTTRARGTCGSAGSSVLSGYACSVACAAGYAPSGGSAQVTCADGRLSTHTLACSPTWCNVNGLATAGRTLGSCSSSLLRGGRLDDGASCTLACAPGYLKTGSGDVTCTNARLSTPSITCAPLPCVMGNYTAGLRTQGTCGGPGTSLQSGRSCTVRCASGSFASGGSAVVSCTTGRLAAPTLTCCMSFSQCKWCCHGERWAA
jgi:hypothetical protein